MPLKIVFIGCVRLSEKMPQKVLRMDGVRVVDIVTLRRSAFHSDFVSLEKEDLKESLVE